MKGQIKDERINLKIESQLDISPYSLFVGSIRSSETKKKYLQRMGYFFDYLNLLHGDTEDRFELLTQKAIADFNKPTTHKGVLTRCYQVSCNKVRSFQYQFSKNISSL